MTNFVNIKKIPVNLDMLFNSRPSCSLLSVWHVALPVEIDENRTWVSFENDEIDEIN